MYGNLVIYVTNYIKQQATKYRTTASRITARILDRQTISSIYRYCAQPAIAHLIGTDILKTYDTDWPVLPSTQRRHQPLLLPPTLRSPSTKRNPRNSHARVHQRTVLIAPQFASHTAAGPSPADAAPVPNAPPKLQPPPQASLLPLTTISKPSPKSSPMRTSSCRCLRPMARSHRPTLHVQPRLDAHHLRVPIYSAPR